MKVPEAKPDPSGCFINKVLLEQRHDHSFIHRQQLLSPTPAGLGGWSGDHLTYKPKMFTVRPLQTPVTEETKRPISIGKGAQHY